jgi:ankyrin repeat protein
MGSKLRRSLQAPLTHFLYIMRERWASPGNSISDFSQLECWRGEKTYLPSFGLDLNPFVEEVAALKCQNRYGKYGMTLLQHAVAHQDWVMLSTLIDQLGADVDNFGNTRGWTLFWPSCLFGDFDIAALLLQKGASTK